MEKRILLWTLLSVFLMPWRIFSIPSFTPGTWVVPRKTYQFELKGLLSQTQATFDKDGREQELIDGESFFIVDVDLLFRYGFGKKTEFFGGGRFRQVQIQYDDKDWNKLGMESLWGGMKYSLVKKRKWALGLEGRYAKTLYSNDQIKDLKGETMEIILGDAGSTTDILGHFTYFYSPWFSFATSSGFRIRPEHLSSEIPFRGELIFYKKKWAVALGVDGAASLENDEYTEPSNNINRPSYFDHVTNGFNSLNRSWTRGFIAGGRVFGPWRIEGEVGLVQSGVSTDKSFDVAITLVRFIGGKRSWRVAEKAKKTQSFKQYSHEGNLLKISPRRLFARVDKGRIHGVDKGMKVDIFKTNSMGNNILYASGVVYKVKSKVSILKIVKRFVKKKIAVGMTARMYQ